MPASPSGWRSCSRPAAASSPCLHINLDRFKLINESLGHGAGDQVLKVAAARIGGLISGRALAARLGADEFAVLVECCVGRRPDPAERPGTADPGHAERALRDLGGGLQPHRQPGHLLRAAARRPPRAVAAARRNRRCRSPAPAGTELVCFTRSWSSSCPPPSWSWSCAGRWPRTASNCTSSPSTSSPTAPCRAWKCCCAGSIPSGGG